MHSFVVGTRIENFEFFYCCPCELVQFIYEVLDSVGIRGLCTEFWRRSNTTTVFTWGEGSLTRAHTVVTDVDELKMNAARLCHINNAAENKIWKKRHTHTPRKEKDQNPHSESSDPPIQLRVGEQLQWQLNCQLLCVWFAKVRASVYDYVCVCVCVCLWFA